MFTVIGSDKPVIAAFLKWKTGGSGEGRLKGSMGEVSKEG